MSMAVVRMSLSFYLLVDLAFLASFRSSFSSVPFNKGTIVSESYITFKYVCINACMRSGFDDRSQSILACFLVVFLTLLCVNYESFF